MYHLRVFGLFLLYTIQSVSGECSDLSESECLYWSTYCSWNSEQNVCEEIGGGGGGSSELGPYEVATYTQNDGMQLGFVC